MRHKSYPKELGDYLFGVFEIKRNKYSILRPNKASFGLFESVLESSRQNNRIKALVFWKHFRVILRTDGNDFIELMVYSNSDSDLPIWFPPNSTFNQDNWTVDRQHKSDIPFPRIVGMYRSPFSPHQLFLVTDTSIEP